MIPVSVVTLFKIPNTLVSKISDLKILEMLIGISPGKFVRFPGGLIQPGSSAQLNLFRVKDFYIYPLQVTCSWFLDLIGCSGNDVTKVRPYRL